MMEQYDERALRAQFGERLTFFPELGSTNEHALQIGREGAPGGAVVLAERQFAGRGRRGADWFCGEGSGLAFSIILRPKFERALWPRLSLVAGLAVAQSIESLGLFPEIKWPNDILLRGRKVCGILVEAEGDCVVVGIGLNVGRTELPTELQEVATSLHEEGGTGKTREDHLITIVEKVDAFQSRVGCDFPELLEQMRTRCALAGNEIEFWVGQEKKRGICGGIGEGGDLLVKEGQALQRYLAAEKIRIIAPDERVQG